MPNLFVKLKKIPPNEFLFRSKMLAYKKYEKIRHVTFGNSLSDKNFLKCLDWEMITNANPSYINRISFHKSHENILNYMRNRQNVRFFIDRKRKSELIKTIQRYFPNIVSKSIKAAETVCNHQFSFLGIDINYNQEIPWTADPVSRKRWPDVFYNEIDIFGGDMGYGDVKHVWEVNRHQYFVNLGKAFWLTGNEKYAKEFFKLIESWIDNNPYKIGVNWSSTLELAYRSISWIWTYYFCLYSTSMDEKINLKILKSLYMHGKYIERHLSFYHSPYNHLIGEATALFLIGAIFPEFKEGKKWKEKGWKILKNEVENQFYPDGGSAEQATFYHHATLGFYLLAAILKKINNEKVDPAIWKMIENATEFSMYMMQPDGKVPMIGDTDDGRSICIDQPPYWDFRDFLSIGSVLFHRGDMKKLSGGFAENSLWLLGAQGFNAYHSIRESDPPETSRAFHSTGYYIMRNSWEDNAHYLCFDCGEQAAGLHADELRSAAHGHADFLSFEVCAFGKPVLIDPGFYTYNSQRDWINYFRQTRAHNTIVVDGENQSKHHGNMTWSNVAEAHCEKWISTNAFDYVSGVHNGYNQLPQPVHHKRSIFFKKPEYWIVQDYLDGSGDHLIESYFHFSPTKLNINFNRKTVFTNNIFMKFVDFEIGKIDLISAGNDSPSSGWIANSYGCKVKAPIIRYSLKERLPLVWYTIVYPYMKSSAQFEVEKLEFSTKKADGVKICFGEKIDYFLFLSSDNFKNQNIKCESDCEIIHFRMNKSAEPIQIAMINGSFFKMEGSLTVKLEKKISFVNINFEALKPSFELSEQTEIFFI